MPRRLRLTTLPHRARRLRRHAVRHFHRTVTLCILGALLLALAVYGLVQHRNTEGAVDVVVGSSLMARLSLPEAGESVPVLEALSDVSVHPTSQQTLVFATSGGEMRVTAEDAIPLRFAADDGELVLLGESGAPLCRVRSVYLPTDETALLPLEESPVP